MNTREPGRLATAVFKHGPFRAFSSVGFRMLWGGSLLAIISFFMTLIARGWLILEMTDSPLLVTAINAVPMIPMTLFPILGGVIADKLDRRLILIISDLSSAFVLLIMALLLFTDLIAVWHVFVLALCHGAIFSIGMPVRAAVVPDVVAPKDMASGVALYTTIFSAAQIAGPAPAGFLIDAFGMAVTFLVASLILFPAAGVLAFLRVPARPATDPGTPRESFLESILVGVRYTRGNQLMMGLLLLGLVFAVFGMPSFQSIMPVFARDVHQAGEVGLGLLGGAMGIGALTGSIVVASFSNMRQLRVLMLTGALSYGVCILLFAIATPFGMALVLTGLVGLAMQLTMTSNFTVIQITSPPHLRGRVMSMRMLAMGAGPLGMLLLGGMTELLGPVPALAIVGAAALLITIVILLTVPALRRVQSMPLAGGEAPVTAVDGGKGEGVERR